MRDSFFDDLYANDEREKLLTSFDIASRQDPQKTADIGVLSRSTGIPPDVVSRNLDVVRKKEYLGAIGIEDLRKNYPGLASYLTNPNNAAISYDDVENLKGLYDVMNDTGPGNVDLLKKSWFDAMARFDTLSALGSLEQAETAPDFAEIHSQDYPDSAKFGLERLRQRRMKELGQDFSESVASAAENIEKSREIGYSQTVKAFLDGEGSLWDEFIANPGTIIKELSLGNAANLAFSAGGMAVGGLTAGAAGVAAGAGISGLGIEYSASIMEGLQNEGFDPSDEQSMRKAFQDKEMMAKIRKRAITRAAVIGTVEMVGGKLATKVVAPASLAAKPVSRETVNLAAQTGAQTALEGTGEALAGVAAGDGFQPVEVAAEMAGSMISAPIDVTVAAATGARDAWEINKIENERKVATAVREVHQQGRVDQLIELAQSSKTGKRDPAALANALQSFGVQDEAFYIDSSAAREVLRDQDLSSMPTVRTQLAESIATGADVSLSSEEFVNEIATSENVEMLRPHIRIGEEGMTIAELEANQTGMVENLIQQAERNSEQKMEADQIYETIREQLVESGSVSDREARIQAQIIPAYVATKAAEYDISVQEAYDTYGLEVKRANTEESKPSQEVPDILEQNFGDLSIQENVLVEETGETVTIEQSAQKVWDTQRKRMNTAKALMDCL